MAGVDPSVGRTSTEGALCFDLGACTVMALLRVVNCGYSIGGQAKCAGAELGRVGPLGWDLRAFDEIRFRSLSMEGGSLGAKPWEV